MAALTALAGAPAGLSAGELIDQLLTAGLTHAQSLAALEAALSHNGLALTRETFALSTTGARSLLEFHGELEHALDPSPSTPGMEDCPSLPWLTTVQTHWLDALSLNYAVDARALAALLPAPLEPELHRGTAWVQVLASRLQEMRPQGTPALFGVNFHQVSFRAAVQYRNTQGTLRRGGYFVRSETDHPVLRAVGNALTEFKFHAFGLSTIALERRDHLLTFRTSSRLNDPMSTIDAELDCSRGDAAPAHSCWSSIDDLYEPLVECYDAFGVDPGRYVYVLTIDREPWKLRFAHPNRVAVRWMSEGPLKGARLDSALALAAPCAYRWRPLRRERIAQGYP